MDCLTSNLYHVQNTFTSSTWLVIVIDIIESSNLSQSFFTEELNPMHFSSPQQMHRDHCFDDVFHSIVVCEDMTKCKQHWTTWQQILNSEYQQIHNKNVHGKRDPLLLPNSIFFGFFWVSISQLSTTFQQI